MLLERYEIARDRHGFDYRTGLGGTPGERLAMMAGAIEWILDKQPQRAAAENTAASWGSAAPQLSEQQAAPMIHIDTIHTLGQALRAARSSSV